MRGIARRLAHPPIASALTAIPPTATYTDLAMTPVNDDDTENLAMFTHNAGARGAVAHARKIHGLTHAAE